jgi:peptidoglycan/LPS O-acetylase OafA/YrhL
MKKLWFKRKQYGWGWTPYTWEGWCSIFLYILLVLALVFTKEKEILGNPDSGSNFITFALPILVLTVLLFFVTYKKGEKPRWQWGDTSIQKRD